MDKTGEILWQMKNPKLNKEMDKTGEILWQMKNPKLKTNQIV